MAFLILRQVCPRWFVRESEMRKCKHDYSVAVWLHMRDSNPHRASKWGDESLAREMSKAECGGEGTKRCIECKQWYCAIHISDFEGGIGLLCDHCAPLCP